MEMINVTRVIGELTDNMVDTSSVLLKEYKSKNSRVEISIYGPNDYGIMIDKDWIEEKYPNDVIYSLDYGVMFISSYIYSKIKSLL